MRARWTHVDDKMPPDDQPVIVVHSEYATPVVMARKDGYWWTAHANGDLTRLPRRLSPPLHWTWLPPL